MNKSTPLNQLPPYTDDEDQTASSYQYSTGTTGGSADTTQEDEEDTTVQDVIGDLAGSIPGFVIPQSLQHVGPQQQPSKQPSSSAPAAVPSREKEKKEKKLAPAQVNSGTFGQLPTLNELAWIGGISAMLFVIISLAPIEKFVAMYPLASRCFGSYAVLLIRAVLMTFGVVLAYHFRTLLPKPQHSQTSTTPATK